ncbi:MAG: hypothetical protein ACT4OM_09325 [Actinomycetota bacterium]
MSPTESAHPYVAVCPYLPLQKTIEFGGWWLGPVASFDGPWQSLDLKEATRLFLQGFCTLSGSSVSDPSLLARINGGVDGKLPSESERKALDLTIKFVTIDANQYWTPEEQHGGLWVATADNADLWLQPLDIANGSLALQHGSRVATTAGGLKFDQPTCSIPAPLELNLPPRLSLDQELAEACFSVLNDSGCDQGNGIGLAVRWFAKSWANSKSVSWEDRIIFLKIASEALSGCDKSLESARLLKERYGSCLTQMGDGVGAKGLLWRHEEPIKTRQSKSGLKKLSAFEHWYMAFSDARNDIAHRGVATSLEYQEGTAYDGPLVEIGDRVLRELIKLTLGLCGYPWVWRRDFGRAAFHCWCSLQAPSAPDPVDTG